MIPGIINKLGLPCIMLTLAGRDWVAVIDTGNNGGVELPVQLKGKFNDRYFGEATVLLGANQSVAEVSYIIDFPFDGEMIRTFATYVESDEILIGTQLLENYSLTIHFARGEVYLQRDD